LNANATITVTETDTREIATTGLVAGLADLCTGEHPTVMGGRVGACLFSSLVFPAGLWAVGAVSATTAALIAATATLLASRAILLLGGTCIARVLALEVGIVALVLVPKVSVVPAFVVAAFSPLIGMLACVLAGTALAATWFARHDRPLEIEVAIARTARP
jgi:hypothetical protein